MLEFEKKQREKWKESADKFTYEAEVKPTGYAAHVYVPKRAIGTIAKVELDLNKKVKA